MIRPSTKLEWATTNPVNGTSGIAAIVEPSSGKKQTGFLRNEKPPRQDMNWLHNLAGSWSQYLDRTINVHQLDGYTLKAITNDNAGTITVEVGNGICFLSDTSCVANSLKNAGDSFLKKKLILSGVSSPWATGFNTAGWGGLDPIAAGWFHVFVMYFDATDTIEIGFDSLPSGSNLLALTGAYGVRRVCSLYYYELFGPEYHVMQTRQIGDYFVLGGGLSGSYTIDLNSTELVAMPTPPIEVLANINFSAISEDPECRGLWLDNTLADIQMGQQRGFAQCIEQVFYQL